MLLLGIGGYVGTNEIVIKQVRQRHWCVGHPMGESSTRVDVLLTAALSRQYGAIVAVCALAAGWADHVDVLRIL